MISNKDLFLEYKSLLFSTAYNMLGSVDDAEDMVQETYLKWLEMGNVDVKHLKAYLVKVVVNKCINYLESAKVLREEYIGTWIPEGLLDHGILDDHSQTDSFNALSIGMLILLEKLTPRERAIFVLREVFAYDYRELSEIFDKNEDNCRQIFRRAKDKLGKKGKRFEVDKKTHSSVLNSFIEASTQGNMKDLIKLFKDEITLFTDSGGKSVSEFTAILRPLQGAEEVSKFLYSVNARSVAAASIRSMIEVLVNGLPSFVSYYNNKPASLLSIDTDGEKISNIYIQTNPDKLRHFNIPKE